MDTEVVLGLISLGLFILMLSWLGAEPTEIILFFIGNFILWPLALITMPIWGTLWFLGNIFDIDFLVQIGESCYAFLNSGRPGDQPPLDN